MLDILSAILYEESMDLRGKDTFQEPYTTAERQVLAQLGTLDSAAADALKPRIYTLVQEQYGDAFLSGTRFGAQLMLQLLQDF